MKRKYFKTLKWNVSCAEEVFKLAKMPATGSVGLTILPSERTVVSVIKHNNWIRT